MALSKKIKLTSFNCNIYFFQGDIRECLILAKKRYPEAKEFFESFFNAIEQGYGGMTRRDGSDIMLWTNKQRYEDIFHESIHACIELFDFRNIIYTGNSQEVLAYTASNVAYEIIEHCRKYSNK